MARRRSYFNDYYYFKPSKPREVKGGLKARSQRGSFGKSWWAGRWIAALERLVDAGRLTRGRSYARKGQVLSIEETPEGITSRVQGSRPKPYTVRIQVAPLTEAQWDKVMDTLAEQALFTSQLLAGEMPQDIEQAFSAAGVSLFPAKRGDLVTECSCPDYANPCKHVAATHYILGERFDEDPFLLFRLRGRTQEQILEELRRRRAGQAETIEEEPVEEMAVPLEEYLEHFWELGTPLEAVPVNIRPPAVEMPILKRLGEAAFVPEPGIESMLHAAYQAIGQQAIRAAFHEEEKEEDEP
jgi:uncharacterized Zn finger protein